MARARGARADVELMIEGRTVALSHGAARRLQRSLAAALGTTGRDPDTLRALPSGRRCAS